MSRQQRRHRLWIPPEVHEHPERFLTALFGEPVEAVTRDRDGRWGAVLAGRPVIWLGSPTEVRNFDRLRQRCTQLGIAPGVPFPPGFGQITEGALRRAWQRQQRSSSDGRR